MQGATGGPLAGFAAVDSWAARRRTQNPSIPWAEPKTLAQGRGQPNRVSQSVPLALAAAGSADNFVSGQGGGFQGCRARFSPLHDPGCSRGLCGSFGHRPRCEPGDLQRLPIGVEDDDANDEIGNFPFLCKLKPYVSKLTHGINRFVQVTAWPLRVMTKCNLLTRCEARLSMRRGIRSAS